MLYWSHLLVKEVRNRWVTVQSATVVQGRPNSSALFSLSPGFPEKWKGLGVSHPSQEKQLKPRRFFSCLLLNTGTLFQSKRLSVTLKLKSWFSSVFSTAEVFRCCVDILPISKLFLLIVLHWICKIMTQTRQSNRTVNCQADRGGKGGEKLSLRPNCWL